MKVMLINPNSEAVERSHRHRKEMLTPIIPLGIAYVAAVLEKNGVNVTIVDQVAERIDQNTLLDKIFAEDPDVVGFSCLTATIDSVRKLADRIKGYNRGIKIVLGNIHASIFADELLKQKAADIVVHGEGEFSMLELVSAIQEGKDLRAIKGISFNDNGNVYHNAYREPFEDLDNLPYPALHLLQLKNYTEVPLASIYNSVASVILASRGCPYRCIFCSQDKIHKKPRYRKIENIIDEIEYMNDRYKIRYFGFTDPFFPFSVGFGLEFCDRFIERGLHKRVRWVTETRVDLVNFELLKRMKEAGAYLIMYGFEVGNQAILDKLRKGTTLEQARIAMRYTKKAGLMTLGLFVLGMPGETKETCEETIRFAKELDCDFVKFNVAIPYPGTGFFELFKEKGGRVEELEKFNSWYDWFSGSGELIYTPEGMSSEELKDLQRKAMFSYYARPRIILKNIIKRRISLKFLFYGASVLMNSCFKMLVNKIKKRKD